MISLQENEIEKQFRNQNDHHHSSWSNQFATKKFESTCVTENRRRNKKDGNC